MEKESSISLGGTIILLALFAQRYIFGQWYTSLYEKGIQQNQNKAMETTDPYIQPYVHPFLR